MKEQNNKNKYLLGFVFYNPTQSDLQRVNTYANLGIFNEIMIFDNSLVSYGDKIHPEIIYNHIGQNQGLAIHYNKMIDYAIKHGYTYLCLLDQDSDFPIDQMKKLIQAIEEHSSLLTQTAVIAPYIPGGNVIKKCSNQQSFTDAFFTINSGSFLNIRIIEKHNLRYDENIFLDGLDYDFCFNVQKKQCKIKIFLDTKFKQNLGYKLEGKPNFCAHAPIRYYYITHNNRYIYKKHFGFLIGGFRALYYNLKTLKNVLIHEECKLNKIFMCLKGMFK